MFKKTLTLSVVLAVLALSSVANAEITKAEWTSVDGDSTVSSSVKNTLLTSMTCDWTNSVLEIDLTAGSLLDPLSGSILYNGRSVLSGTVLNEDDTWVNVPNVGDGFPNFDDFDVENGLFDWFDNAENGAVTDGMAARIYASDDAQGTWSLQMFDFESAGTPTIFTGLVVNGAFGATEDVPEPSSIALLLSLVAAIGLMIRRK